MPDKIIQLNDEVIKKELGEMVRESVEKTLNELLDKEVERLTNAGRYKHTEVRQAYRSGHYERELLTTSEM